MTTRSVFPLASARAAAGRFSALLVALGMVLLMTGCEPQANTTGELAGGDGAAHSHDHGHGHHHDHPSHGPHGGDLIELGNEEYHAEVLIDGESVTIHILDGHATGAIGIEAAEITLNLARPDGPRQFALAARPDDGDAAGTSSRFVSDDAELYGLLRQSDTQARLSLTINGKPYTGRYER